MSFSARIARIFRRPHYQSEVTGFIEGLKSAKPSLESEQRAGRALLWDKNLDRSALAEYADANVPQKPYVYSNNV
jgi:Protein of unknown function (DUF3460)